MCMTAIFEEKLGKRREGWCVYLSKSRDFTYLSDKQIKVKLGQGEKVNGLMVNENDEVIMDEGFTISLLSKSGLNTFVPLKDNEDSNFSGKSYALVKVMKSKGCNRYELVSNRCGLEIVDEDRLKAMLSLIGVGGVRMDDKGKLVIHTGVDVETVTEGAEGAS